MMKKAYIKPCIEQDAMENEQQLLTGSIEAAISEEQQSNESALGRDFDFYDDEEE